MGAIRDEGGNKGQNNYTLLGYVEQSRHLTDARMLPEVKSHLQTIQQDALERSEPQRGID
jgi:hypothetical protein